MKKIAIATIATIAIWLGLFYLSNVQAEITSFQSQTIQYKHEPNSIVWSGEVVEKIVKHNVKHIPIKNKEKPQLWSWDGSGKCYHNWYKWWIANDIIQYACDGSNSNVDFILTLQHEWSWDPQQQSNIKKNWVREPSFWICQMQNQAGYPRLKRIRQIFLDNLWQTLE